MAPPDSSGPAGKGPGDPMRIAHEVLHELRQPLLGVKAYVQMMPESDKGLASLLLAQVERMEQILSDFNRLNSGKPAPKEPIDLAAAAQRAHRQFSLQPDAARVTVDFDVPAEVPIEGNARLIEQLVLNLLNNAKDAMSGLGRIKVVIGWEGKRPTLSIADWGPGIPPDLRDRIFEPYVTTKTRGSGLGLAVCRRIAAEHNAQLTLAPPSSLPDEPPPATVFKLVFSDAPSVEKKRLLVVDDEGIIRAVFKDLMGKECEVATAETAEEALSLLKAGRFDLIVTDKNLPGASGLDLAKEARKLDPHSRVILMTGYPSVVTAQQALELGVLDYLLKPFDEIREVREKIRQALAQPEPTPTGQPSPAPAKPSSTRIDVYEDNEDSAQAVLEALGLLKVPTHRMQTADPRPSDDPPSGVVISWDFSPAPGKKAIELARAVSRGAPFVVLTDHLTMEATLESLRGGASACLPKLLTDVKALSRELARALKL